MEENRTVQSALMRKSEDKAYKQCNIKSELEEIGWEDMDWLNVGRKCRQLIKW